MLNKIKTYITTMKFSSACSASSLPFPGSRLTPGSCLTPGSSLIPGSTFTPGTAWIKAEIIFDYHIKLWTLTILSMF